MTPVQILAALEVEFLNKRTSKAGRDYIRDIVNASLTRAYRTAKEPKQRLPGISSVIDTVCKIASIEPDDIKGPSRKKKVKAARHLAMYLLMPRYGPAQLGRIFKRDHTSVIHAVKSARNNIHQDTVIGQYYSQYLILTA